MRTMKRRSWSSPAVRFSQLVLLLAVPTVVQASGCNVLLGDSLQGQQCQVDTDCISGVASDLRCDNGFCVRRLGAVANLPPEASAGCVSTDQCTQDNQAPSICPSPGMPCVKLSTDTCKVYGDYKDPNAIFLGAINPLVVTQVDKSTRPFDYAEGLSLAHQLALDEWASLGGIPINGTRRPLALVECNDAYTVQGAKDALLHLTDVVKTPAVMITTDFALQAVGDILAEKKIAAVCSDCVGPLPEISGLGGLVFRTIPQTAQQAPLAVAWVKKKEAQIRTARSLSPSDKIKVAVLSIDNPGGRSYADKLFQTLEFNGVSATANGSEFYKRIDHPQPILQSVDVGTIGQQIADFTPDILLVSTSTDFQEFFGPIIESKWPQSAPKPHYIVNELAMEDLPFRKWVGANDELRQRITGVAYSMDQASSANIAKFADRYAAKYGDSPDLIYSGYDAFYSLAYAVVGASTLPTLSGPNIADAFKRLNKPPTAVNFSESDLAVGVPTLLTVNQDVDVHGLWTSLDWDPKGDVSTDSAIWCLSLTGGKLHIERNTGVTYSLGTKQMTGTYTCP